MTKTTANSSVYYGLYEPSLSLPLISEHADFETASVQDEGEHSAYFDLAHASSESLPWLGGNSHYQYCH